MPLPVHDRLGSAVNLAKATLLTLDARNIETPVQTETLRLLLEMFIGLAQPNLPKMEEGARKTVAGHIVALQEAHRAEADLQAQRGAQSY